VLLHQDLRGEMSKKQDRISIRSFHEAKSQKLGFDIRSTGSEGTHYIEVKGRAAVGSVALARNEWIKAQRLGDD
jgi:hypothetical protein